MKSRLAVIIVERRAVEDRVIAPGELGEESPDSKGTVLGNAQAERSDTGATESIPPMAGSGVSLSDQARVKRRGKSPPTPWGHGGPASVTWSKVK